MQLSLNRVFSDRFVFDEQAPGKLRVTNSFWDWCKRIISWIYSPSSYSEENRRTIRCFKNYLVDTLGQDRLQRICARYSLDFDKMEKRGSPLLSRDIAKIVIGAKNITVADIDHFQNLDKKELAREIERLSRPFGDVWKVADIFGKISGQPTEWRARWFYDPFLADRERQQLTREHPRDVFDVFMHNMVARVIKREMDVGTLVHAPNHPDGSAQFYYVSAKLITGEGMVSYIFHPATSDTNLEPVRLFRGMAARNGEIDGISSVITGFETDLGRSAYESGRQYDPIIAKKLTSPTIEGGHSLGSVIVQYRLANTDHIKKAYLFCGLGIPEGEVEKFNQKNGDVHLIIRHSSKDRVIQAGGIHLGYRAPARTHVEFCKHHFSRKENQHIAVPGKDHLERYYGIEGGISCDELHHTNKRREKLRSSIGPWIAYALRKVRDKLRPSFPDRAEIDRGLKIGSFLKGCWQVESFRSV